MNGFRSHLTMFLVVCVWSHTVSLRRKRSAAGPVGHPPPPISQTQAPFEARCPAGLCSGRGDDILMILDICYPHCLPLECVSWPGIIRSPGTISWQSQDLLLWKIGRVLFYNCIGKRQIYARFIILLLIFFFFWKKLEWNQLHGPWTPCQLSVLQCCWVALITSCHAFDNSWSWIWNIFLLLVCLPQNYFNIPYGPLPVGVLMFLFLFFYI